jgi:hypothetical protein
MQKLKIRYLRIRLLVGRPTITNFDQHQLGAAMQKITEKKGAEQ